VGAGGATEAGAGGGVDGPVCALAHGNQRASSPADRLVRLKENRVMVVWFFCGCGGCSRSANDCPTEDRS
jgi:hypothetical protein